MQKLWPQILIHTEKIIYFLSTILVIWDTCGSALKSQTVILWNSRAKSSPKPFCHPTKLMLLWLSLALLEMFSAGAVPKRKLKWIFWQNMATVKFLILCVCCSLGVCSENSKSIENLAVVMQHYISARELWFFWHNQMPRPAQCPFHDYDKEDQMTNDKWQKPG